MSEVKQNESYLAKSNNINDKNLDFVKDRYQDKINENNTLISLKNQAESDHVYYSSFGTTITALFSFIVFMLCGSMAVFNFVRSSPEPLVGIGASVMGILVLLPVIISEVKSSTSKQEFNRLKPIIKENSEYIKKSIREDTIEEFSKALKKQHNATFVDENFPYVDTESTKIKLNDGTIVRSIVEYTNEANGMEVSILDNIDKISKIKKDSDTKRTSKAKNKFSLKNRYKKIKKLKQAKQD